MSFQEYLNEINDSYDLPYQILKPEEGIEANFTSSLEKNVNNIKYPFLDFDKPNALDISKKTEINYEEPTSTFYPYYFKHFAHSSEENMYNDFFSADISSNESDILIYYLKNSKTDLLIKLTNRSDQLLKHLNSVVKYQYTSPPKESVTFKERMISYILRFAPKDFTFTHQQVSIALENAIQDFTFIKSDKNTTTNSRYVVTVNQLKNRLNFKEKGIAKIMLEVTREIAKMRAQEKHSYNEWISSKADPSNYFGISPYAYSNKDFSIEDLRLLLTQIKNYKKNSEDFKKGKITTIEDLQKFMGKYLTAGGDQFKWFINTPFFSLSKSQRKTYIEMFCDKDESFFSRISIAGGVSHGDIVLMLFSTCKNEQELLEIILELEKEDKLFKLLYNLKLNAFKDLSILISNVYMKYLEKGKKDGTVCIDAIENGRQLYFDNGTFGNHNVENFDTDTKKLVFETRQNVILDLFTDADYDGTINASLQKPFSCKPLDIISFTPKRDIEFDEFKFLAKQNYQLPACLVYLLYRQESIDSVIFAGLFTLQVALCLTGVGEVIAAIEAGSTFGVIWTGSAVAIDTAFASILIKEVEKDHPIYAKTVNYIVWVRVITEFIQINKLGSKIEKEIREKPIGGKGPKGFGKTIGKFSKRPFNPKNAGGEILNLTWENAHITKDGIDIVKRHLSRFDSVTANRKMINRLEKIEKGDIPVTAWDKRFYTHEIREYERYKNLGVKDGVQTDYYIYNDLHTATLEDFKLSELDEFGNENLYHPEVNPEDFHF